MTSPSAQPVRSLSAPCTDARGFTLVEVLVSMVICVVGLIALAELMAVTLKLQQLSRNGTSAVRMAQDKVDELTTMNFATNASVQVGGSITADQDNYNDTITIGGEVGEGQVRYTRRWLIEAGPDGDPNLRQVTVRIIPESNNRTTSSQFDLVSIIRGTP